MNDLSGHETELLVVVENRVHVFDPESINRAVENDPFVVGSLRRSKFPEYVGDYA